MSCENEVNKSSVLCQERFIGNDIAGVEKESGGMSSWVVALLTSKLFIAYCILNYCWVYYVYLKTIKSFGRKDRAGRERDEKYHAFKRNDIEKFQKNWILTLVQSPTLMFRALIGYIPWCFMLFFSILVSKLDKEGAKVKDRASHKIIRMMQKMVARWDLFLVGCWPGLFAIEQVHVDYRKYLGPDWKNDVNKTPTTIVANHQSFFDIVVSMYVTMPSVIAKEAVRYIPVVGKCAELFGCLFLTREDKSSQRSVVSQIIERQTLVEQGYYSPLKIYPEGGTSNGKYIINFKKGAFLGLKSIQPMVFKYESPGVELENCIISLYDFIPFALTNLWLRVTVKQFPVFEPNDYFFQHHQRDGEDKWAAYARVVRTIMAENSGLALSDFDIEDKYAYKRLLFPKKKASA